MGIFMQRIYLACYAMLYVLFMCFVTSCSEQHTTPSAKETALATSEFRNSNSIKTRVVDSWSAPEAIGNPVIVDISSSFFHGPSVKTIDANSSFVSWRLHSRFDPVNGGYQSGKTTILKQDAIQGWINSSPVPIDSQINSKTPKISFDKNTGHGYAIWLDTGKIFVSHYQPQFGWDTPIELGIGSKYWISAGINNSVLAVWMSEMPNNSFTLTAAQYTNMQSWNRLGVIHRDARLHAGSNVIINDVNNGIFSWYEQAHAVGAKAEIYAAKINYLAGWQSPKLIHQLSSLSSNTLHLRLGAIGTSGNAELVFQVSDGQIERNIYTASFRIDRSVSGDVWLPIQRLNDNNGNRHVLNFDPVILSTSNNGYMAAMWIEDQNDGVNMNAAVVISQFLPATGWSPPKNIVPAISRYLINSPPLDRVGNFLHDTSLSVSENGEITAAWVRTSRNINQIMTTKMSGNNVWEAAKMLTSNQLPDEFISRLSMDTGKDGTTLLAWQNEKFVSPLRSSIRINISHKNGMPSGQPIDPFDPNQPMPINHIPSTNECLACHIQLGFVMVDHTQVLGACYDCHNGILARGKKLDHISATNNCNSCHLPFAWLPVYTVDHSEIFGSCIECHNGIKARGKISTHILASNQCEACHGVNQWTPLIAVDHNEVVGTCYNCHNGVFATGKSILHIPASNLCESCHNANAWLPAVSLPNPNNGLPSTKPLSHIASSDICSACHLDNAIFPVFVDHTQVLGECNSCHNNIVATGKPFFHLTTTNQCILCHLTTNWNPVFTLDHSAVVGTCYSCHDGSIAIGKLPTHVLSTNFCDRCHTTDSWIVNVPPPVGGTPISNWESPVNIKKFNSNDSNSYIHGPVIEPLQQGASITSYVLHEGLNSTSGNYDRSLPFISHNNKGSFILIPELQQYPWNGKLNVKMLKIKSGAITGDQAGILWKNNRELTFNTLRADNQISESIILGDVDGDYYLLGDNSGSYVAIWFEKIISATMNLQQLNAKVYRPSLGWSQLYSIYVPTFSSPGTPLLTSNNQVIIPLAVKILDPVPNILSSFVAVMHKLDLDGGWQSNGSIVIPENGNVFLTLAEGVAGEINLFVRQSQDNGSVDAQASYTRLLLSSYHSTQGWSVPNLFAPQFENDYSLIGEPVIGWDDQGKITALWMAKNELGKHLFSRSLNVASNEWEFEQRINTSTTEIKSPSLTVGSSGKIFSSWISDNGVHQILHSSQLAGLGWGAADNVAIVDKSVDGEIMSSQIKLDEVNNALLVSWSKLLMQNNSYEYDLWFSRKALQ